MTGMSIERVALLSERQLEILRLAGTKEKSEIIAERVGLSPNTVNTYTTAALRKLGISSRYQASLLVRAWDAQPEEFREMHRARLREIAQQELIQTLKYQPDAIVSAPVPIEHIDPAADLMTGRETEGGLQLREERAWFGHAPRSTHLGSPSLKEWVWGWGNDNHLEPAAKLRLIFKLTVAILVITVLAMISVDTLHRMLIERGFIN